MSSRIYMFALIALFAAGNVVADEFASGYVQIHDIMCNAKNGMPANHAFADTYAKVANLHEDVNLAAITDYFSCMTYMGKVYLEEALSHPVSPATKDTLVADRQKLITLLMTDPAFKAEIEHALLSVQQIENSIAELFSEGFEHKTCPELQELQKIEDSILFKDRCKKFMIQSIPGSVGKKAIFTTVAGVDLAGFMVSCKNAYQLMLQGQPYTYHVGLGAFCGVVASIFSYIWYQEHVLAVEKRQKLCDMHTLIKIADTLEKLVSSHALRLECSLQATAFPKAAKKFIQELRRLNYANKDKKIFFTAKFHALMYQLYQQKDYFASIFGTIAQLDACNAIANKMLGRTKEHPWCFAVAVDQKKPMIHAERFWNVLVEKPVVNTLIEDKNIILTGPNMGGKSTAICSLLQNIVLAQSFGVAASAQFEYTPFHYIYSCIRISDDLMNGLSLFVSEVKRAQEILEQIKAMKPHEKYFFALDELFTGTNILDGEACACEYIMKLAEYEAIQIIYATHFEKLKELGDSLPNWVNYKVDAPIYLENGELAYPFTISKGASNVRVGLDVARNSGLFR